MKYETELLSLEEVQWPEHVAAPAFGYATLIENVNRKVAHDVTHFAPKKWLTKCCNLCCKGMGRTPIIGVISKTNEKFIKN